MNVFRLAFAYARRRPLTAAFNVAPALTQVPDGMTDWDIWRDTHAPLQEAPVGGAPGKAGAPSTYCVIQPCSQRCISLASLNEPTLSRTMHFRKCANRQVAKR